MVYKLWYINYVRFLFQLSNIEFLFLFLCQYAIMKGDCYKPVQFILSLRTFSRDTGFPLTYR